MVRRPFVTQPRRSFTRVHPFHLSLARFARIARTRLGLHPPAFARLCYQGRLRGSGTGLDTGRDRKTLTITHLERARVARTRRNSGKKTVEIGSGISPIAPFTWRFETGIMSGWSATADRRPNPPRTAPKVSLLGSEHFGPEWPPGNALHSAADGPERGQGQQPLWRRSA
jgi:hypothetical protein